MGKHPLMKNKRKAEETVKKIYRALRKIFGWTLTIISGFMCWTGFMCAVMTLFGLLEIDSFGEWLAFLVFYVLFTVAFAMLFRLGLRIKKIPDKKHPVKAEKATVPTTTENIPEMKQPPVLPEETSSPEIQTSSVEKQTEVPAVQKPTEREALATFSPEEQQRFENRRYQYTQDTGRDGRTPEEAAEVRGVVFVDGRPVVREVAERMEDLQKASQPTPYTRAHRPFEIVSPCNDSIFEQESARFLYLSEAHLADKLEWGQEEYFAVDTEEWKPYYILSQYDGDRVARTWYIIKEAVTWDEVTQYADPSGKTRLGHSAKLPWGVCVLHRCVMSDGYRIRWRSGRSVNRMVEIRKGADGLTISDHKKREVHIPWASCGDQNVLDDAMQTLEIRKTKIREQIKVYVNQSRQQPYVYKRGDYRNINDVEWRWLWGAPGMHGDLVRVGRLGNKYYLEISNDGYPNRMAAGGIDYEIPAEMIVVQGGKRLLKTKEVEAFYRSLLPQGPELEYALCDWFWTEPGRPEKVQVIHVLLAEETPCRSAAMDFEKKVHRIELVRAGWMHYVCEMTYGCTAEANGRPLYHLTECYYGVQSGRVKHLTADNWSEKAEKHVAYLFHEVDYGVRF